MRRRPRVGRSAGPSHKIVIEPLSEEDGGGFLATVPELAGCLSDGETRAEALANVEDPSRRGSIARTRQGSRYRNRSCIGRLEKSARLGLNNGNLFHPKHQRPKDSGCGNQRWVNRDSLGETRLWAKPLQPERGWAAAASSKRAAPLGLRCFG
jgi:hypothetical protein